MDDWAAVAAEFAGTASATGISLAPFVDAGAAFAAAGVAAVVSLSASAGAGASGERLVVAAGCDGTVSDEFACDAAGAISVFGAGVSTVPVGAAVSAVPDGSADIGTASAVAGMVTAAGIAAAALPISVGAIPSGDIGVESIAARVAFVGTSATAVAAATNNAAESEPAVGVGVKGCDATISDAAGAVSSFTASMGVIGWPLSSEAAASIAGASTQSDLAAATSSPTGTLF